MANETSFDRRIVNRNIKRGLVTRKEYDQYISNLEDVTDKAVSMEEEEAGASTEDEEPKQA